MNTTSRSSLSALVLLPLIATVLVAPLEARAAEFETGSVDLDRTIDSAPGNSGWADVAFDASFGAAPVIVAGPVTHNNEQSLSVRVRNVTTGGFEIALTSPCDSADEDPNKGGLDCPSTNPGGQPQWATETVRWMAVPPGTWTFPDGTKIEAARDSVSAVRSNQNELTGGDEDAGEAVSFANSYSSRPVVLHTVNTTDDADWITSSVFGPGNSRGSPPDTSGFTLALEGAEVTTSHDPETIGWVAVEPSSGTNDGIPYHAGVSAGLDTDRHEDGCFSQGSFSGYAPDIPDVIAAHNTMQGGNGGWTRYCDSQIEPDRIDIHMDEDQVNDGERTGIPEATSWFAFGADGIGLLVAPIPPPLTEYRMEESAWDGTSNEVTDETGNGHDGTAEGDATTRGSDPPAPPARSGDPGTCRYGDFDGNGDYVADDDAGNFLNGRSEITVTTWVRNTQSTPVDAGIFTTGPPQGQDNRLGIRYDASGASTGNTANLKASVNTDQCAPGEDCIQVETESGIQVDDSWQHVAMTWESGDKIRVYIDGAEVQTTLVEGSGNLSGVLDDVDFLRLGQSTKGGADWQGQMDEFRVYGTALSQLQIESIFQDTHPCAAAGVDHFTLSHDNAGINCRPENVVLRAEDASGNPVTDYTGSVDLSTTTSNGDWAIGTGNGSLSDGGGDDGSATYTFAGGDDGEVTLAFSNTHAETLNIDATDGTASDDDTEGDITFRPWGFEFTPDPIPTQVAGRPFDLTLTAVGELPSDPGCNVIEEYDGDRDLAFWFDYEDPGSGTVDVTVDGTAIAGSETGATDQTIAFSNGEATVPVDYRDAGEIQLHAKDDDGVGEPPAASGDELVSGGAIGGGTNPFVVRPFGFYLDFDPDGDGTFDDRSANTGCGAQTSCAADATGDVFATAGADFAVRIAAVVWQSADDSDGDGRPDGNAILGDNAETPNFGQEATPETVDLARTLVAPSPGASASLANATGIGGFSGGAREVNDLRYSEVGIIDLDATLSDGAYLGTVDVGGAVADVGRFRPADFAVSVREAGMYAATCAGTFSYVGEAFGYELRPRLDITARNAGGATTENYRGNFIKLAGADVAVTPPTSDASAIGNVSGTTDVAVTPSLNTGAVADDGDGDALGNGVLVYSFDGGDRYTYDKVHNARIDAFDADLPITVDDVTDADGVTDASLPSPNPFTPTGVQIRFGRLIVDDAFGPEIAPVEQRWRIEYWQGTNWATNAADGCTTLALGSDVDLTGDGGTSNGDQTVTLNDSGGTGTTEITSGDVAFTSGTATVVHDAPGEGERGWIGVASDLGAAHHLLVDDNDDGGNDGPYDVNPAARVTFGVFAGESEQIYLREVFPTP